MLCASQASTRTISSTMDQTSQPSSSSSIRLGGRTIDRHNPIIRDAKRFTPPPSPSPSPNPNSSYHTPLKSKLGQEKRSKTKKRESEVTKSSPVGCFSSDTHTPQGSSRYLLSSNPVLFDGFVDSDPISLPNDEPEITEVDDLVKIHEDRLIINASKHLSSSSSFVVKKQQDQDQEQPNFFDGFLDYEPVLSPDNPFSEPTKGSSPTASLSSFEDKDVSLSPDFKFSSPQLPPPPPPPVSPLPTPEKKDLSSDQVVVLRVSLHCKGCAGKVKKHLSKMKGVTSFDIDFAAKKVTVTGDVTPLTVLATISKVKNAQFWPEIIQNHQEQ